MESAEALAFRQFLTAVTRLRQKSVDYHQRLTTFLIQAKPLVVGPARRQWQDLKPLIDILSAWHTNCDLLDKIVSLEDSYTELIAWALRPATHPKSALLRQRNWLASLGVELADETPAEPRTQMPTNDGVPDLVLPFETQTIIVEVKTDSDEHPAPSGKDQTFAYLDAVRSSLHLSPQHSLRIVFLTPDSRPAKNPDAMCTNFAHFAVVLAKTLAGFDLPDHIRVMAGMVISLLSTFELPIQNLVGWSSDIDDALLMEHIGDISLIAKLLPGVSNV